MIFKVKSFPPDILDSAPQPPNTQGCRLLWFLVCGELGKNRACDLAIFPAGSARCHLLCPQNEPRGHSEGRGPGHASGALGRALRCPPSLRVRVPPADRTLWAHGSALVPPPGPNGRATGDGPRWKIPFQDATYRACAGPAAKGESRNGAGVRLGAPKCRLSWRASCRCGAAAFVMKCWLALSLGPAPALVGRDPTRPGENVPPLSQPPSSPSLSL